MSSLQEVQWRHHRVGGVKNTLRDWPPLRASSQDLPNGVGTAAAASDQPPPLPFRRRAEKAPVFHVISRAFDKARAAAIPSRSMPDAVTVPAQLTACYRRLTNPRRAGTKVLVLV
jgi:hypothetical protein